MKYGVTYAGPRRGRRVRRGWRGTLLTVLTLLTLAALCGWLLHVLRSAGDGVSSFILHPSSFPVAMAPVPQGVALGLVLLGAVLLIGWSVVAERRVNARRAEEWDREVLEARRAREMRERVWREARAKARRVERWSVGPLESLSEAESEEETEIIERLPKPAVEDDGDWRWGAVTADGKDGNEGNDDVPVSPSHSLPVSQSLSLPLEDLRRIVGALRVETRAARDLVMRAELQDGGYIDLERLRVLREALASLHKCVGCVEGLAEALELRPAKAGTTNLEWPSVDGKDGRSVSESHGLPVSKSGERGAA